MEGRKEEFIKDLVEAIQRGENAAEVINNWERQYLNQFDTEDEFSEYMDEVEAEAEDIVAGHKEEGIDKKDIIAKINKWLKYIRYGSRTKLLTYDELKTLDLSNIHPNLSTIGKKMEGHSTLQKIFNRVSELFVMAPNEDELKNLSMSLENFYEQLSELDLTLAKDRKKFYDYWKKVQETYPELVAVIDDLKEAVRKSRMDSELKQMFEQLNLPSPYVVELDPIKLSNFRGSATRILEFLELLGGKRPRETSYERGTKESEVKVPLLSRRPAAQIPGGSGDSTEIGSGLGDKSRELLEDIEEIEVDPIMAKLIKEDWFTINVGMGDGLEKITAKLQAISKKFKIDSALKNRVEEVLEEIQNGVQDFDRVHLPLTLWLKDLDISLVEDLDEVTSETGEFFGILNRIFLTSGLFPISMDVRVGSPGKGRQNIPTTGAGPAHPGKGDKPPFKGVREPRAQGGQSDLPTEREIQMPKKIQTLIKRLFKLLNDYYFHPMSKGLFVDGEKPEFIDKGGKDFGEKFDPDALTREGRLPFRAMDLVYGTHPKSDAIKTLMEDATVLLDSEEMEKLEEYLRMAKKGYEMKGLASYISKMETMVKLLDEIFPSLADENRIWAAGQIGEVLINHQEDARIKDIKLFGKPIAKLHEKWVNRDSSKVMPLDSLRSILQDDTYTNMLRREEQYGDEKEVKALRITVDKILDLTAPEQETVRTDIEREKTRVQKSILVVHDYIRKMEDRPIYYGNLNSNNLDDMDYLISKIESENKVELNVLEVNSIIDSVNSHMNISKSFGLNEEVIYKVKGLCR